MTSLIHFACMTDYLVTASFFLCHSHFSSWHAKVLFTFVCIQQVLTIKPLTTAVGCLTASCQKLHHIHAADLLNGPDFTWFLSLDFPDHFVQFIRLSKITGMLCIHWDDLLTVYCSVNHPWKWHFSMYVPLIFNLDLAWPQLHFCQLAYN